MLRAVSARQWTGRQNAVKNGHSHLKIVNDIERNGMLKFEEDPSLSMVLSHDIQNR